MISPVECAAPKLRALATPTPSERTTIASGMSFRKAVEPSVEPSSTTISSLLSGGSVSRMLVTVAFSSCPSFLEIITTLIRGEEGRHEFGSTSMMCYHRLLQSPSDCHGKTPVNALDGRDN